MFRKKLLFLRSVPKLLAISSIFLILFNEYIVYITTRLYWNSIQCSTENCTRLLLVADPQILGETFDKQFYNEWAQYDADRFLRKSYASAFNYVQPDAVCFMGDLMDEGSVATIDEYGRYFHRFEKIYHENNHNNIPLIHIAGDNDIGGERSDSVTPDKVNRFKSVFGEPLFYDVKNKTRLFNVNLLTSFNPPNVTKDNTPKHLNRIIITHISLLSYQGFYSDKITAAIRPDVIFSAHQHVSRILTYPPIKTKDFTDNSVLIYDFTKSANDDDYRNEPSYFEIMLPTCSYRMGVKNIGFGMAVIENNVLRYTVLWLPNRFTYLYLYLIWIVFAVLTLMFWIVYKNTQTCLSSSRHGYNNERYQKMVYNN